MPELVMTEVRDRVMIITVNRPEARNAINYETAHLLADAFDELDSNPDVYVGILTGAGNTFSSGMDLKAFARDGQRPLVDGRALPVVNARPANPLRCGGLCTGRRQMALAHLIVAANTPIRVPKSNGVLCPAPAACVCRHAFRITLPWK